MTIVTIVIIVIIILYYLALTTSGIKEGYNRICEEGYMAEAMAEGRIDVIMYNSINKMYKSQV